MRKVSLILCMFLILSVNCFACDDTLIMMLTAKDPSGEFSKVMRAFSSDLTNLGLALNANRKEVFSKRMEKVMFSWLEFSKAYSFNPPPEARNDKQWIAKIKKTSVAIGKIRKYVSMGNHIDAHDAVLDLSSKMGMFFEGFGISDEKQMFIDASASLTRLRMHTHKNNSKEMTVSINELQSSLEKFDKYLPKEGNEAKLRATNLLASITSQINSNTNTNEMELLLDKADTTFKELRSHILMKEWFSQPNTENTTEQKNND